MPIQYVILYFLIGFIYSMIALFMRWRLLNLVGADTNVIFHPAYLFVHSIIFTILFPALLITELCTGALVVVTKIIEKNN